jgi:hypothetical protein
MLPFDALWSGLQWYKTKVPFTWEIIFETPVNIRPSCSREPKWVSGGGEDDKLRPDLKEEVGRVF